MVVELLSVCFFFAAFAAGGFRPLNLANQEMSADLHTSGTGTMAFIPNFFTTVVQTAANAATIV